MKWLDAYIDGIHRWTPFREVLGSIGPFSRGGSLVNVIICGAGTLLGVWLAVTREPASFFIPLGGLAMTCLFIRIHVRARRGDFD